MLSGMNRKTWIILLTVAVLIIGSVTGYALTRPSTGSDASAPAGGGPSTSGTPSSDSTARYVEYSPSAISDAAGTTLLFFHASWCPSCRQIESEILDQGVPDGVTIIKVDYDSHQDLRQKYGVTIQTTFVKVDSAGNEIQKFVPYGGDLSLKLVLDTLT